MSELAIVIDRLDNCTSDERETTLSFIQDFSRFMKALRNINNLVGLERAKKQVANQIKMFIVNWRLHGSPANGGMLHTLLCGPPGCGKTTFGRCLATLWSTSGCLSVSKKEVGAKSLNEHDIKLKNAITLLNNTRHKVRTMPRHENRKVQAQFQAIKDNIKNAMNTSSTVVKSPIYDLLPIELSFAINGERDETSESQKPKVNFHYLTRGDIIGPYQGKTVENIRKKIDEARGGVIMIDEAYELCNSENDSYGREALTEIISHMSTYPDRTVFIFAGYRDRLEQTILTFQPGLKRRFNWSFDLDGYTPTELASIFRQQMTMTIDVDDKTLSKFFSTHKNDFPYFAGDTERLSQHVNTIVSCDTWLTALDPDIPTEKINIDCQHVGIETIEKAYKQYTSNQKETSKNQQWKRMFN